MKTKSTKIKNKISQRNIRYKYNNEYLFYDICINVKDKTGTQQSNGYQFGFLRTEMGS